VVLARVRVRVKEGGDGGTGVRVSVKKRRMVRFQGKKRQRRMRTIVGCPW
jgi:hypothetical protein